MKRSITNQAIACLAAWLVAFSTFAAANGSISITAAGNYTQTGSNLVAQRGNISVTASNITINEARETGATHQDSHFEQSSLTLGMGGGAIGAMQSGVSLVNGASKASGRMQLLAAGAAGLGIMNAASSVSAAPSISLTYGSTTSTSSTDTTANAGLGSTVSANNINLNATGAGRASTLTIQGSSIQASNNVALSSTGDIFLLASSNTETTTTCSSASSSSASVSNGAGGWGGSASASQSNSQGSGAGTSYTNTQVSAGNTFTLSSSGNTTFAGALVSGNTTNIHVAGNLTIQSQQDQSSYTEQGTSSGVSVGYSGGQGSGSISSGRTNISSNFLSVNQTSGVYAGNGGFNISVGGRTNLVGGLIASTANASQAGVNRFTTQTLTTSDVYNSAVYSASSTGVTLGSGAGAGFGSASGDASSTTASGISGGLITVGGVTTNTAAGQTLITTNGNVLNTNVTTGQAGTGIAPIFNVTEVRNDVQAQVQITQNFLQQGSIAWGAHATQKYKEALESGDAEAIACWAPDGPCRAAGHMLIGGLAGGVGGAMGAGAGSVLTPQIVDLLNKTDLPIQLSQVIVQLTGLVIGGTVGGGTGAATGLAEAANNAGEGLLGPIAANAVRLCGGSTVCTRMIAAMGLKAFSEALDARIKQIQEDTPSLSTSAASTLALAQILATGTVNTVVSWFMPAPPLNTTTTTPPLPPSSGGGPLITVPAPPTTIGDLTTGGNVSVPVGATGPLINVPVVSPTFGSTNTGGDQIAPVLPNVMLSNGYITKPTDSIAPDWRIALDNAFDAIGLPKTEFTVEKWARDANGKSFPVEWSHPSGAEVNIDIGHTNPDAPPTPHIGWQTGGKRASGGKVVGHVFVPSVPVNRSPVKQ